ncbi:hypothetical protein [Sphingobium aquiterrae]|uniref:hypothetical protein n=1 Tax=Sphingobium aquiterrae TaxID=2038656 RepID=UPI003AFA29E8
MPSSVTPFLALAKAGARLVAPLAAVAMLAACGGGGGTQGNSVALKDLEKADGTTTDAMTDLDGVRAEGTALAETGNATAAKPAGGAAGNEAAPKAADNSAEVLTEQ